LEFKNQTHSFLGKDSTFEKAYPKINKIQVIVDEYDGFSSTHKVYGKNELSMVIPCGNKRCKQGGYPIDQIIYIMVESKKVEEKIKLSCEGHEGSPKGREKGESCYNYAEITIKIEYN
jgi:hypothetical protein